eukprot:TRINITY_DN75_c0_g1_i1.p1 TRINITY_DN75_c0_g1~~TRINITY_DN75_c0_g1_i1.p1  ORF type:complete len:211 (+),score=30.85 TRINITY_DN75_c0_g1_i1:50-682(+)
MGSILSLVLAKKSKSPSTLRTNKSSTTNAWAVSGGTDVKIVIVGSGGVGKSSITLQFVHNTFPTVYDPTIEDNFRKQALIDDKCQMLDILDTAGQEEFACMRDQWVRTGEGFIIVYAVDDRIGFDAVREHQEFILRVKDASTGPFLLVANKIDVDPSKRQISTEEGKELAKSLNISSYIETSAFKRINIDEAFYEMVREVRRHTMTRNVG